VAASVSDRALWRCPACGRTFAARNQVHTCAVLGDLERHFAGREPVVRATFDAVLAAVAELGPVEVLAEAVESPRFVAVQVFAPHNVVHEFRLDTPTDVDEEFRSWLAMAYDVGRQRHHGTGG
jgi:hypothetical protein